MTASDPLLLVFCTCPDTPVATRLAAEVVGQRLAACVSQLPGLLSTFRWDGQITQNEEVLLMIKTTAAAYPQLEQTLQALHPYELPEIVAVPVTAGLPGYLAWVTENTIGRQASK